MPWKKTEKGEFIPDANGDPVQIQDGDGKEISVNYDAIVKDIQTASKGEEKYRKEAAELKAKYAPLADVKDIPAYMEQHKALADENGRLKAEQGAEVQAQIKSAVEAQEKSWLAREKGWEAKDAEKSGKLAEAEKQVSELKAEMTKEKVRKLFVESKFIAEKCDYGPISLFDIFKGQCGFDEDGRFVGLDAAGEKILGADGKIASFDEWAYKVVLEHPDGKTKMLKGSGVLTPGAGGSGNHRGAPTNPWKKETWNATEQNRIFREQPDLAKALAREAGVALPTI
jgi:hypothetical protein